MGEAVLCGKPAAGFYVLISVVHGNLLSVPLCDEHMANARLAAVEHREVYGSGGTTGCSTLVRTHTK